jgi:hypothetical protein
MITPLGKVVSIELISDGANIPVTNENREGPN